MNTDNYKNREETNGKETEPLCETVHVQVKRQTRKKRTLCLFAVPLILMGIILICRNSLGNNVIDTSEGNRDSSMAEAVTESSAAEQGHTGSAITDVSNKGESRVGNICSDTTLKEEPGIEEELNTSEGNFEPDQISEDPPRAESPSAAAEPTAVPVSPEPAPEPEPVQVPVHTHIWVHHDAITHTVHHDAEYATVHHDAVTEQVWVVDVPSYDLITCTGCGAQFTDRAGYDAHTEYYAVESGDMSHGYSVTTVPEQGHYETRIITEAQDEQVETVAAWDEVIVDSPAYDECSGCGIRQ